MTSIPGLYYSQVLADHPNTLNSSKKRNFNGLNSSLIFQIKLKEMNNLILETRKIYYEYLMYKQYNTQNIDLTKVTDIIMLREFPEIADLFPYVQFNNMHQPLPKHKNTQTANNKRRNAENQAVIKRINEANKLQEEKRAREENNLSQLRKQQNSYFRNHSTTPKKESSKSIFSFFNKSSPQKKHGNI